jgi:methylamine dehydrogenase accessory protein MauD
VDAALVIARLLLAAVFAVAGGAKLADLPGSRAAIAGFGVPDRLAAPLGTILPCAELAIAVLLLPAETATAAGFAAFAMLVLFSIGITASMARGEAPECHCFGQLHSKPAGPQTLARNLILAVVAAFVGFAGAGAQPAIWETAEQLEAGTWAALGAGLALALVLGSGVAALLSLLRRNGLLLLRVEALEGALIEHSIPIPDAPDREGKGLPIGSAAPEFELPSIDGDVITLASLLSGGRPALLVFTSPRCAPCEGLMPKVAAWQRELVADLNVAVLADGDRDENQAKLQAHGLRNVLIQETSDVAERYVARATPSALLVSADGRIASALAAGGDSISALVAESTNSHAKLEVVRGP